jgi:Ca-activated chloride channel family protein
MAQAEVFQDHTQREHVPAASEPVGRDKFANAPGKRLQGRRAMRRSRPSPLMSIRRRMRSSARSSTAMCLPPAASVRTEELINYFPYAYEAPASADEPFRANVAVFPNPWAEGRKLIRIGVKGYALHQTSRPRANLGFPDRYIGLDGAGRTGCRWSSSRSPCCYPAAARRPARDRDLCGECRHGARTHFRVRESENPGDDRALEAGGSTAGAEGIRQAYALAEQNFDATASTASFSPPTATSMSGSRARTS